MGCKHGNWSWCEECRAEDELYTSAYESGKKEGWEACESCHGIVDGIHTRAEKLRTELAAAQAEIETRQDEVRVEQMWVQHWHKETLNAQADNARLREAFRSARDTLQFANDSPNGGISDTIWMMHRPETLFDFMDSALATNPPDDALKEYGAKLVERIAENFQYGACSVNESLFAIADKIRKGEFN